ncbi:hypothetical protein ACFVUH_10120 [Kitasatospora sp. NPDC058032]|uniref:hypothetical protein n=1 Tax=Kitasatospora sp. NPDC058032 TaxID=3346307 RepID=UPI0036DCCA35
MSDAVPQYGFTVARRGYAPEQVDRALTALTAQRDEGWERLSVLGAGLREMERRLAEIQQAAADAPEPDYQVLSDEAAGLARMAENEARAVRDKAERFAEDLRDEVYEAGQALDRAAKEYAATTRTEADAAVRRTDERTRAEAETIRAETDREVRSVRDAATGHAAKVRVAAAEASERAEAKLAELRRKADEMFAEAQAEADAEDATVSATAERRVKEAEQFRETVLGQIKQSDAEAQARADQLVEQARREAERINAASDREQREYATRLETVQQHLDHIKATLASLTGAAVGAIEPAALAAATAVPATAVPVDGAPVDRAPVVGRAPVVDSEADTGEIPLPVLADPRADLRKEALPAPASEAATAVLRVTPGRITPAPAAAVATGPVPPRPATPPSAPTDAGEGPAAPAERPAEEETRIIPKIVIIDDGSDYATPNTVGYHRR